MAANGADPRTSPDARAGFPEPGEDTQAGINATIIANVTSGKSKFLTLEYREPKIRVVGPATIVRFHWMAESESVPDGKKSSTNLHILMNWQKQGAGWKLLSRASTKL